MSDLLDAATRILSTTAARWQRLAESTPEDLLRREPAPGEWSAAQCLQHMLVAEREVFGPRLRALLEGVDMVAFDPSAPREPEPERGPVGVAAALAAAREEHLAVLSGLTPADLDREARHPQYGMLPLRVVLSTWAAHDLQHTVQAEEALMQAFLPGTGPFRFRFAAHEATPA
jgi:uncharacterized damage-inducible protein DinB